MFKRFTNVNPPGIFAYAHDLVPKNIQKAYYLFTPRASIYTSWSELCYSQDGVQIAVAPPPVELQQAPVSAVRNPDKESFCVGAE